MQFQRSGPCARALYSTSANPGNHHDELVQSFCGPDWHKWSEERATSFTWLHQQRAFGTSLLGPHSVAAARFQSATSEPLKCSEPVTEVNCLEANGVELAKAESRYIGAMLYPSIHGTTTMNRYTQLATALAHSTVIIVDSDLDAVSSNRASAT